MAVLQSLMDGLARNRSLQWLGLGGNGIGPEGARVIAQGLPSNQSLQWLALGGNDIGDRGAKHLATALKGG